MQCKSLRKVSLNFLLSLISITLKLFIFFSFIPLIFYIVHYSLSDRYLLDFIISFKLYIFNFISYIWLKSISLCDSFSFISFNSFY
jgi:hypothetical protein